MRAGGKAAEAIVALMRRENAAERRAEEIRSGAIGRTGPETKRAQKYQGATTAVTTLDSNNRQSGEAATTGRGCDPRGLACELPDGEQCTSN